MLEERGNALLGNLLSLLSASEFMFAFGGEVLPPHLEIHGFDLSMIESGCWESLPTNRCLKVLRMESCNLGGNTFKLLSSALKRNSTLQRLMLDDTSTAHGRFGAFGDAWAVNLSLKMLRFHGGRIQESDLYDLAKGLRRNRTWKVLWLPCDGLTPQEFGRFLETVRYENSTLDQVFIDDYTFPLEQAQLDLALPISQNVPCVVHGTGARPYHQRSGNRRRIYHSISYYRIHNILK